MNRNVPELNSNKVEHLRDLFLRTIDASGINATECASLVASLMCDVLSSIADDISRRDDAQSFIAMQSAAATLGDVLTRISKVRHPSEVTPILQQEMRATAEQYS